MSFLYSDSEIEEIKKQAVAEYLVNNSEILKKRWIPVNEKLPNDFDIVYATCVSLIDNREPWVIEGMYHSKIRGWSGMTPMLRYGDAKVVAWMPKELPKPYKEAN